MEFDLFETQHYRDYLIARVGPKNQRLGVKSKMAAALRCQPSMISHVLAGTLDLSLEQGESLNQFFKHTEPERHYFLLLLQHARAATKELKQYFGAQLEEIRARRKILTKRIGTANSLTHEQRSKYYSTWQYAAIHIATTIPELQSREALAHFFAIPRKKLNEVIDFLEQAGLVVIREGRINPGKSEIFVGSDSELIIKHHTNWRLQAIDSLERESEKDLHYSAIASVSREDVLRIKKKAMLFIENTLQTLKASAPEEELYSFNLDFFGLNRSDS